MTTITAKIPGDLALKLETLSVAKRVSKSKIIRDALSKELKTVKKKTSLYEAMEEGFGCFDSGVTDLATNPKHMKGFGKWRQ
jgi:predicted transcriptional regulator